MHPEQQLDPQLGSHDRESVYTLVTTDSSQRTQSNLPGLGRNLGNLYSYLGLKIENILSVAAVKTGRGPRQTAKKIRQLAQQDCLRNPSLYAKLEKAGKGLVKHVRYATDLTFMLRSELTVI